MKVPLFSIINGSIEFFETPREGSTIDHPEIIMEEEVRDLDSAIWRTGECQYFQLLTVNAFEYTFQLDIDLEFEGTADWYLEIYNSTNYLLNTTSGLYSTGEWPRLIEVPTVFDSDYSLDGIYILRVVYNGTGTGHLTVLVEDAPGATMDTPLWHTFEDTEYRSFLVGQTWTPEFCPPKSGTGNDSVGSAQGVNQPYCKVQVESIYTPIWKCPTLSKFYAAVRNPSYDRYEYIFGASETEYICFEILPNNPNEFVYFIWSLEVLA